MEDKIKSAIEEYQCSGCIVGGNISCFMKNDKNQGSVGCGQHMSGSIIAGIGNVFLGMPKGFNRLGKYTTQVPVIFDKFVDSGWKYNEWNVPVWKHLDKMGHTLVRGIMPRLNEPFLHIFLEDCRDSIDCLEVTQEDIDKMD